MSTRQSPHLPVSLLKRFTDRARKVMALANQEAQRFNHEYIGTEHILLGVIKEATGVGATTLKNLGLDLRKIRLEVEKRIKSGPDMVAMGKLPQTPRAKKAIEYAIEEARNLNHNYVGTEHLLLGLLRDQDSAAAQVLMDLKITLDRIREEVHCLLGRSSPRSELELCVPDAMSEEAFFASITYALCKYRDSRELLRDLGRFLGQLTNNDVFAAPPIVLDADRITEAHVLIGRINHIFSKEG